jgi:hypothetical protein
MDYRAERNRETVAGCTETPATNDAAPKTDSPKEL